MHRVDHGFPAAGRGTGTPAFEPVRLDAGPVAQHHFVGGFGSVGTCQECLGEKLAGMSRKRCALLPANGAKSFDAVGIEDWGEFELEGVQITTRLCRAFFLSFLSRCILSLKVILYARYALARGNGHSDIT